MKKLNIFLIFVLIGLVTYRIYLTNESSENIDIKNQSLSSSSHSKNTNNNSLDKNIQIDDHSHFHEESEDNNHQSNKTSLDDTMLSVERIYTQQELEHMTSEQFQSTLKDIALKLPKKSDLKTIPEGALHHTPSIVIRAAREISVIAEVINLHPEYEIDALNFYETCAQSEEGVTTVKALCLTNIIDINNKNKQTTDLNTYSKEIVELSKMVLDN